MISNAEEIVLKAVNPQGYKLQGTIDMHGLHIKVENRKGSVRSGKDPNGNEWSIKMKYPYGYISRTKAADDEHVDCYVGDSRKSENVYIVHQVDPSNGKYDEDKCMLGFDSAKEAKKAYLDHYDSPKFFGSMTTMKIDQFKSSLKKNKGMKLSKAIQVIGNQSIINELELAELIVKGVVVGDDFISKGGSKVGLVQKKVWVTKQGKTYQTTVWVKEGEDVSKKVKNRSADVAVGDNIAVGVLGMDVKRYSDKAVLITGNTYDNVEALREVKKKTGAGNWNRKLKGWIFPISGLGTLLGQLISNSENEQADNGEYSVDSAMADENRKEVKNAVPVGAPVSTGIGKGEIYGVSHDGDKVSYTVKLNTGKVIKGLEESDFTRMEQTDDKKVRDAMNAADETNRSATQKALSAQEGGSILDTEISNNKGKEEVVVDLQKKRQSFISRLKGLATPKKAGEASKKKKSGGYSARASMTKADLNAMLEEMNMMTVEDYYKATFGEAPKFEAIKKSDESVDPDARSKAMKGNKNAEGKGKGEKEDFKVKTKDGKGDIPSKFTYGGITYEILGKGDSDKHVKVSKNGTTYDMNMGLLQNVYNKSKAEAVVKKEAAKFESDADFLKRSDKHGQNWGDNIERWYKSAVDQIGEAGKPSNFKDAAAEIDKMAASYEDLGYEDKSRAFRIVAERIEKEGKKHTKDQEKKKAAEAKKKEEEHRPFKGTKADVKQKTAKKEIKKAGKVTVSGEGTSRRIYSAIELIEKGGLVYGTEEYRAKEGWGSSTKIRKTVTDASGKVIARGSLLTVVGELVRQGKLTNEDVEAYVKGSREDYENDFSRFNEKHNDLIMDVAKAKLKMSSVERLQFSGRALPDDNPYRQLQIQYMRMNVEKLSVDNKKRDADEIAGAHLANIQFEISETTIKNIKSGKQVPAKDYRNLPVNQMKLYSIKNILDTPRPNWIPEVSDDALARRGYSHDAMRLESGDYLVAMNGFVRSADDMSNYGQTDGKEHNAEYIIMSREHFAAMSDYYITRKKAENKKEAEDKNKRAAQAWEDKDEAFKARYPGGYKKYGAKRVKVLKPKQYLNSQAHMLKEFIDPNMSKIEESRHIMSMKEDLGIAWNDFTVSNEDYSGAYQKGKETSYGDSNTKSTLLKSHGIKVKKQNGDEIDGGTTAWIAERMDEVYSSFGSRKETAKEWGLKVSHSGERNMHASKAIGMFIPAMNAIGVSEKYGSTKGGFTLAHEFAHFMDYQMAQKGDGKRYFASHDTTSTAGKIAIAMRSNLNDRGLAAHKYYGNSHECFARAMEQYHAMKHGGDDVMKITVPYSEADEQVKSDVFNKEIKPLIEQFVKETKSIMKSAMNDLVIFEAERLK